MSCIEYKALLSAVICYNTSYSSKIPVEVFVAGRVKYNKKRMEERDSEGKKNNA